MEHIHNCGNCAHFDACNEIMKRYAGATGLAKDGTACGNYAVKLEDILGDDYDLAHLRELIRADREGRCFVFLVPPDRNSENADVVICDDGEEYLQRVYEVDVGKNSDGEMNCIYLTNGGPDFETADIGKTVFLPHETDKIEAALAKMREEGCE